ncbi:MAG: alpha/beta hydrolase [Eubacteriales bacterium]|nr:alpha/beta hydrolase [Eubacteriales bacterium]
MIQNNSRQSLRRSKKHRGRRICIGIAAVVSGLGLIGSLVLAHLTVHGKRQTLTEAKQWQADHYDISWFDRIETQTYEVVTEDGYRLHAQLCLNPQPTERYVILSHGYTDNRFGSLKYMKQYMDLGYHCIIYDLRGHGENEPTFCTYGIREGRDIATMVADARQRFPQLTELGLHGESLGAASSIYSLRFGPQVDFVVADCGFADIESVLSNGYRQAGLPGWLTRFGSFGSRLLYGYSFSRMRPIDSLAGNKTPILFIHGEADRFILPEHSRRMSEAAEGFHQLVLVNGADHAASVLSDPDHYRELLQHFLQEAVGR